MAVSSFLRPICLYNRIVKFKCRLREAVVLDRPLDAGDEQENWSCSAFMRGNKKDRVPGNQKDSPKGKGKIGYTSPKQPCRNCQVVFQNLKGFIPIDVEAGNRDTFQGACAEYIPVNELMKDDTQDLRAGAVKEKLEESLKRCICLLKNYRNIVDECDKWDDMDADNPKEMEVRMAAYDKVTRYIHIFGFKPELRM